MTTLKWTLAGVGMAAILGAAMAAAQQGARGGEWNRYGGDAGTTRYAPLDQINKANVSQLRIAWQRPAVDASISSKVPNFSFSGNFRATPLMIGGVLYSPNGIGLVEAFHGGTGKTVWVRFPTKGPKVSGAAARAAWRTGLRGKTGACS
jgi:quinoprotein glucose dehydrogenase